MKIDGHQHLYQNIQYQLGQMAAASIDKTVLFCTTPHPEKAESLAEVTTEMSKLYKTLEAKWSLEDNAKRLTQINEEVAEACCQYPDSFMGFASLPLEMNSAATKAWIRYWLTEKHMKGFGEFTPATLEQVALLEKVLQALADYPGVPIWVHTFTPMTAEGIDKLLALAKAYPATPIIFGHMGGYHWVKTIQQAKSIPNVYLDISASFSTLALKIALRELPDRVLLGSDAPYGDVELMLAMLKKYTPDQETYDKVAGHNLAKLLHIAARR